MRPMNPTLALLAACTLALGACSGGTSPSDEASPAEVVDLTPETETLATALDNTDGVQTMAEALKETGIAGIFQGKGSYTLLAPDDDAFAALGDAGKALTGSSDHAALAALIKDHLVFAQNGDGAYEMTLQIQTRRLPVVLVNGMIRFNSGCN